MKTLIIVLVIGVIVVIGGYVIYTQKSGEELDEPSPLKGSTIFLDDDVEIKDNLNTMSDEQLDDFMEAIEKMEGVIMRSNEDMPDEEDVRIVAEGHFKRRFHAVEGKALLIAHGDTRILRFEDFATDNGPNLHIYLSSDLSNDDFVDLGEIRATNGNVNYDINPLVDTDRYNKVLVWCVPFGVLFSYAELN